MNKRQRSSRRRKKWIARNRVGREAVEERSRWLDAWLHRQVVDLARFIPRADLLEAIDRAWSPHPFVKTDPLADPFEDDDGEESP